MYEEEKVWDSLALVASFSEHNWTFHRYIGVMYDYDILNCTTSGATLISSYSELSFEDPILIVNRERLFVKLETECRSRMGEVILMLGTSFILA